MPGTVNKPGTYKARVTERGLGTKNELTRLVCAYAIEQERDENGEWYSVTDDEMGATIVGYHTLEKKDGSLNTVGIDQIKRAFGWDGHDLGWLNDAAFNGLVQIRVDEEEYNGKQTLKVNWLDHEDAPPAGVHRAGADELAKINDRLGAKLRANSGGKARPGPAKPTAAKPTAAKTAPAKTAAAPTKAGPPKRGGAAAPTLTMNEAWTRFNDFCRDTNKGSPMTEEAIQKEWSRLLEQFFPGKADDDITPEQWAMFATESLQHVIPF